MNPDSTLEKLLDIKNEVKNFLEDKASVICDTNDLISRAKEMAYLT